MNQYQPQIKDAIEFPDFHDTIVSCGFRNIPEHRHGDYGDSWKRQKTKKKEFMNVTNRQTEKLPQGQPKFKRKTVEQRP